MPSLQPITFGNSIAITVAAASAVVALPTPRGDQVIISSPAANGVNFIAFGAVGTVVVIPTGTPANGLPVLPNSARYYSIPPGATHIATIGVAANTLYVTVGDGGL